MNPQFNGVTLLFRGLTEDQRRELLPILSAQVYAPRIPALPDPFALIPSGLPLQQQASVARGMLKRTAASLSGDFEFVPSVAAKYNSGDFFLGDAPTRMLREETRTIHLPIPEFAVISLIRNELGGRVPEELVGILNSTPVTQTGDYIDGDDLLQGDALEGGWFSKISSIVSKAAPMISKIANSPIGKMAMKAMKVVPVLGNAMSAVETGMAALDAIKGISGGKASKSSNSSGMSDAVMGLAADAAMSLGPKILDSIKGKTTADVMSDVDNLENNLEATYGKEAVNDAIVHVLAVEGDFYDDVASGNLLGAPSLQSGDWMDTAKQYINGSAEALSAMSGKAADAGSKAYGKLSPKVKQAWSTPWGKASIGAAGVAGSALLYLGAAKLLKNRPKTTVDRVVKAKNEKDAKKAANLVTPGGSPGGFVDPSSTRIISPPPGSLPALPPIDTSSGLPPFGGPPSNPGDGPIAVTVTRNFVKVPFAGNSLESIAKDGNDILDEYNRSLMTVNPAFQTGDICDKSYADFGADFLLHGFPIKLVTLIPADALDLFNKELKSGASITSPSLTRRIIGALMAATSGTTDALPLLVADVTSPNGWAPLASGTRVILSDKFGNYVGDMYEGDDIDPSDGSQQINDAPAQDSDDGATDSGPAPLSEQSISSVMPGERVSAQRDEYSDTAQLPEGQVDLSGMSSYSPGSSGGGQIRRDVLSPVPINVPRATGLVPQQPRATGWRPTPAPSPVIVPAKATSDTVRKLSNRVFDFANSKRGSAALAMLSPAHQMDFLFKHGPLAKFRKKLLGGAETKAFNAVKNIAGKAISSWWKRKKKRPWSPF